MEERDMKVFTLERGTRKTEPPRAAALPGETVRPLHGEFRGGRERRDRGGTARLITGLVAIVLLSAALVMVCFWGREQAARADALELQVQSMLRRTFFELADNVGDLQVALKKLSVTAGSTRYVQLLQDVRRLSGAAAANLGSLPASHVETADLNRFVVQTGDYAAALSAKVLGGAIPGEEDRRQLAALYEASVQLSAEMERRMDAGEFPMELTTADGYYADGAAAQAGSGTAAGADASGGQPQSASARTGAENTDGESGESDGTGAEGAAGEGGSTEEENLSDYPTLIYDGPFSDSTEKAEPRGLPETTVDAAAALAAASRYLGGAPLSVSGETGGTIETYNFTGKDGAGRNVEIAVTKRGGKVLWMMAETAGTMSGLPDETAAEHYRASAKAFLDARGYAGMESSYAQYYAGVAVLNFAATQGGVLLYPDLVKVYVERESGQVVGVDAQNYLFSHCPRELPLAVLTEEEAKNAVSDALTIETVRLALIPKTAATEVLCYECTGTAGGATFAVYINAVTGAEEEIFEILQSDEGEFTV